MKISIAWVFDHIKTDWRTLNIADLIARFNQTTAEIESVTQLTVDLSQFTIAKVTALKDTTIELHSPEWQQTFTLPTRKDAQIGSWFLLKKDTKIVFAAAEHFGCEKGFLMPALYCEPGMESGSWKKQFEAQDYILDVDNKSITHRPDMWGHRGFAREIAAILDIPLKPLSSFLTPFPVNHTTDEIVATQENPISIRVESHQAYKRIAALYVPSVKQRASSLWMMHRLVRVNSKSIDALVDATNYVMFDIGQPMHAFDAHALATKKLVFRMGNQGEQLKLLDGEEVAIEPTDFVVTDGVKPLGLAGIMGGSSSSVGPGTTALFLESGCWDAATIRRTATRLKKRSEASARYEKTLDPNQTVLAIQRYIHVLHEEKIVFTSASTMVSVGTIAQEERIDVEHSFLEKKLGVKLDAAFIERVLVNLEFNVQASSVGNDTIYSVIVPTFRGSKDIKIKEDIAEEICRFYGFLNIPQELPQKITKPGSTDAVYRVRMLKRLFAEVGLMRETQNYAFYDEEFLASAGLHFTDVVTLKNPVSEQAKHLVTSLIPHILKNVVHNGADNDQLRFFEWARMWHQHEGKVIERRSLAAVIFDKKNPVDFYAVKQMLTQIFDALHLSVRFVSCAPAPAKWYMPYKTAQVMVGDQSIGYIGCVNQFFFNKLLPGDAFIIELDGDFLLNFKPEEIKFMQASKYPAIERDISLFVPVTTTVDTLTTLIKKADTKISAVTLVDFFEKKETAENRAVTFRCVITDHHKTLTKEEADTIMAHVISAVAAVGATVR
jgi:phenylalanyl-tRNA synthetase beta chain